MNEKSFVAIQRGEQQHPGQLDKHKNSKHLFTNMFTLNVNSFDTYNSWLLHVSNCYPVLMYDLFVELLEVKKAGRLLLCHNHRIISKIVKMDKYDELN